MVSSIAWLLAAEKIAAPTAKLAKKKKRKTRGVKYRNKGPQTHAFPRYFEKVAHLFEKSKKTYPLPPPFF